MCIRDRLTLSATSDTGQAAAQVATQMEGAPLTIKFNGAYILDMITGMPNDALMFEMTTPSRPAAIYSFTAGKDAHLAIPVSYTHLTLPTSDLV